MGKRYSVALFNREELLFKAVKVLQEHRVRIHEVYSPYPVHGLDKLLKCKHSRLPIVGFCAGVAGGTLALGFQIWSLSNLWWPHNIGGKPALAIPSFIPVTFEMTVLFAAFVMVGAFFLRNKLYPRPRTRVFHERATDDLHCLVIENMNNASDHNFIAHVLQACTPLEILERKEDEL